MRIAHHAAWIAALSIAAVSANAEVTRHLGRAVGHGPAWARGSCGTVLTHADGTWEDGFAFEGGGVRPPYYGAFAECFSGTGQVCALDFAFSAIQYIPGTADLYIFDDDSGVPGAVHCLVTGVDPGEVPIWPDYGLYQFALSGCCVSGNWWAGIWGAWPGGIEAWFLLADLDVVSPSCSMANYTPGIGYPSGWHDASLAFGEMQSLAIGAEISECSPVPTEAGSWGRVKTLYR